MRRSRLPHSTRMIVGLLIGLLTILTLPLTAQPTHESRPYYDLAKEVTLSGTVSSVVTKHSSEMVLGSHLLLATASGELDASLGKWGLEGKGSLSVAAGQEVEVTGVMKTIKNKQVFIARTVKAAGHIYTIRNKYGIAVSPQSRERASHMTAQVELNGGAR
jgi:hypothetical protein